MNEAQSVKVLLLLLLSMMQLPVLAEAKSKDVLPTVDESTFPVPEVFPLEFSVRQTYPRCDQPNLPLSSSNVPKIPVETVSSVYTTNTIPTNDPKHLLPARPVILNQPSPFGTMQLSPSAGSFPLYTVNVPRLHISIFEVPVAWMLQTKKNNEAILPFNSRLAFETDIETGGKTNKICKTEIPLQKFLAGGVRQLFLRVSGSTSTTPVGFSTLLQLTDLSITALSAHDGKLYCNVCSFANGRPVAAVRLHCLDRPDLKAVTDENGLAHFNLGVGASQPKFILAEKEGDAAVLRTQDRGLRDFLFTAPTNDTYAFTDRSCYQAGDTVNVKGWFRERTASPMSDLDFSNEEVKSIAFNVTAQSKEIAQGQAIQGHLQSFSFSFVLPKEVHPGRVSINLIPSNAPPAGLCSFLVVDPKSPPIQVLVDGAKRASIDVPITFNAAILDPANSAVMPVPLEWSVFVRPARFFTIPGWDSYSFAPYTGEPSSSQMQPPVASKCISTTDALGKGAVEILLAKNKAVEALEVAASATVKGQVTNNLVQPDLKSFYNTLVPCADICVGVCADTFRVAKGTDAKFKVVVLDLKGNVLSNRRVQLNLYRSFRTDPLASVESTKLITTSEFISQPEAGTVQFRVPEVGGYLLRASTYDEHRHKTESCVRVVADEYRPLIDRQRKMNQDELHLKADKDCYAAGDVITMTLSAPFKSYSGIYTVRTDGVVKIGTIKSDTSMCKFSVPTAELYARSCKIDAIVHANDPAVEGMAMFSTSVSIPIEPVSRILTVTVTPHMQQNETSQNANVDLLVTTHDGKAAADADVCAIAIDDSQLAQTAFKIKNPIDTFYHSYLNGLTVDDMYRFSAFNNLSTLERAFLMDKKGDPMSSWWVVDSDQHYTQDGAAFFVPPNDDFVDAANVSVGSSTIALKEPAFRITPARKQAKQDEGALFQPNLRTDKNGRAIAYFNLSNKQTGYHIFVVAASQAKYFGIGEAEINGAAK